MIDNHFIDDEENESEEGEEDDVLTACALYIQTGSIERVLRELRKKLPLTEAQLNDVVAEATFKVMAAAPRELRQSPEAVVSWHRWNYIYGKAMKKGNMKDAMDAQKNMDNLMARVH